MADQDFVFVSHSDAHSQMSQEEIQKILEWLSPTEYSAEGSEFQKHVQAHVPDTGSWIYETNQYKKWSQSGDIGTLWIKGVPGSGKSIIAANLIKSLSEKHHEMPVFYFFFRNIISTNSKPLFLIRDFLAQLLPFSSQLGSSLKRLMIKYPEVKNVPTSELWHTFTSSLPTTSQALIVVDALDEIEVGEEGFATTQLLELGRLKPASIKLIVTSRPLPVFDKASETPNISVLRLLGKVVDQDISRYISHRLDHQRQREFNKEERYAINAHLCDGEQPGLFLQARLMLDELLRGDESVERLLTRSLDSMTHIFQNILHEHSIRAGVTQEFQLHVLEWITHASRPLRLLELAELFLSQGIFPDIHKAKSTLKVCCGPLLEILDNETLSIIHHSFTEFLLDTARLAAAGLGAFPALSPLVVHTKLVSESIDYLLFAFSAIDANDLRWAGEQKKKEQMLKFPFLPYAIQNWTYHFSKGVVTEAMLNEEPIFRKLDILLKSESSEIKVWLHFCSDAQRKAMLGGEGIHIASFLGLTKYVEYLLQSGADPNIQGLDERTPLMFAASQGHTDLIRLIAKAGGDVEASDCLGLRSLHHAAIYNRGAAIDELVQLGADPMCSKTNDTLSKQINFNYYDPLPPREFRRQQNQWGGNPGQDSLLGRTPIQFSCEYGCSNAVKSLMQHLNSDQRATIGLHWIGQREDSEVLSTLLQYPEVIKNINQVDGNGNTPLILASRDINPEVVRILLQAGATTSPVVSSTKEQTSYITLGQKRRRTKSIFGKTPLNAWAELFHNMTLRDEASLLEDMEKVAAMLIRAGCDVDVRSPEGLTPLFLWNDHVSTPAVKKKFVSILLGHGADPNAKSNCGSTPLHNMRGREEEHEAVLLLLKAGADINAVRASDGRTPILNVAFATHDVPDVKPFIGYRVSFTVCDHEGNSVLHYMMKKSVSKYPLEGWFKVCDTKIINKVGETCLFSLCHQWPGWGLQNNISRTIYHGVSLESRSIYGRTALTEACCEGGNDQIKAFLAAGADARVRDNRGRTCLHLILAAQPTNLSATSRSAEQLDQIISELTAAGADPKATDHFGNHLIHSAIWKQKPVMRSSDALEPIRAAIKFGNDPKAQNYAGQNALHLVAAKRLDPSIKSDNADIMRMDMLLKNLTGIDLSAKDRDGLTPVHLAAASSEAVLFQLIDAGADVRIKDHRDRTPLHFAAASLSNATGLLCEIYTKNSWNVDDKDIKGRTPLHEAASVGNYEAVVFLLQSGADPSQIDELQKSPLHFAAAFRREAYIDRMEQQFYSKERDSSTLFTKMVNLGDLRKLQRPLGLWLDDEVSQRNAHDVVCALREAGAAMNPVDYLGRVPYDIALLNGNEDMAESMKCSMTPRDKTNPALFDFPGDLASKYLTPRARNIAELIKSLPFNGVEKDRYLETAVYMGNVHILRSLLNFGVDPKKLREVDGGFTIVHSVVATGQILMMKNLENHIGDINEFDPPLLHTVTEREGSNLEMMKILLELGADPDAVWPKVEDLRILGKKHNSQKFPFINQRYSLLHKLATGWCWWYVKAITLLVDNGVDLEVTNSEGMTALQFAISNQSHGYWRDHCLDALLSSGADVNKVYEKKGLTPLNMALEEGCGIEVVQKLLKYGADIGAGPNPPLISAIRGADLKGTKLLLDAGADPNGRYGPEKRLPLQIAVDAWVEDCIGYDGGLEGLEEVIALLLNSGADPLAEVESDELGLTKMFHFFCLKNAPITPFIDSNVDLEVKDSADRTPLHAACSYYGYIPQGGMNWAALELISNGVEVDVINSAGDTPLHCTMQTDSDLAEVFHALLRDGASVNIPNLAGRTAIYYALRHVEYDVYRKDYLIESLMEKGASPDIGTDDDGVTNLHVLAEILADCVPFEDDTTAGEFENFEKFNQQFLDLGCDPEARDDAGNTPAFFFVKKAGWPDRFGHKSMKLSTAHWKRYLHNFDVQAVNEDGDNLLHVVARRQENYHSKDHSDAERLFKLLMDMGVDPKKENKAGISPLDVAATCGKTGILEMFEREETQ